jgi:hypothetical protein
MRRVLFTTFAAGGLALSTLACGDDAPTTDEWADEVSSACAAFEDSEQQLEKDSLAAAKTAVMSGVPEDDEIIEARTEDVLLDATESFSDDVDGVGSPDGDADLVRQAEAATQEAASAAQEARLMVESREEANTAAEMRSLFSLFDHLVAAERAAQAAGSECQIAPEELAATYDDGDGSVFRGMMRQEFQPSIADVMGETLLRPVSDDEARCITDAITDSTSFDLFASVAAGVESSEQAIGENAFRFAGECIEGFEATLRQQMFDNEVAQGTPPDLVNCYLDRVLAEYEFVELSHRDDDPDLQAALDEVATQCATELGYLTG